MALAVFVIANDVTAMSVALPAIENDFDTVVAVVQWVVNAYALVFGVLIVTVFSQRKKVGSEHDTPLEHTKGFQYVDYEYGRTQEEALAKMARQPQMRPAGQGEYVSQKQWIPPQQAPSAKDLPTPFARSALAPDLA